MTTTGRLGTPQSRLGLIVLGSDLRNPMTASVTGTVAQAAARTGTVAQTGQRTGTVTQ